MKIGGNDNADNNSDDAVSFDFVVGRYAIGKILGNLAVEKDSEAAAQNNDKTNNHPSNTKRPV